MILAAVLALFSHTHVDAGLQADYRAAVHSWRPYRARVKSVEWCKGLECSRLFYGGLAALWIERTKTIEVLGDFNFPPLGMQATLAHEYGHALGLPHVGDYSIMRPSWEAPWPVGPTQRDREWARHRSR